jgi:holliday junction DNA helicase RuvA
MIARLHGHVAAVEDDAVIIDVGGVGYRVRVPAPVAAELVSEGAPVTLHTRLAVRENEVVLYGSTDPDAMTLFDDLLTVTGIGPRLALAMLSTFEPATLVRAIVGEDAALLSEVPGVGRKTAQRLVLELKGRLEASGRLARLAPGGGPVPGTTDAEAEAALLALGYTRGEARRALAAAGAGPDETLEARILAALRWLSQ